MAARDSGKDAERIDQLTGKGKRQPEIIRLSIEESVALAELILAEPVANEKAVAAIRHFRKTMSN